MTEYHIPHNSIYTQLQPSNAAVFEALSAYPTVYLAYRHMEHLSATGGSFTNAELAATLNVTARTASFCVSSLVKLGLLKAVRNAAGRTFVTPATPAPDDVLEGLRLGTIGFDLKKRTLVGGWTPASRGRRQRLGVDAESAEPKANDAKQLNVFGATPEPEEPKITPYVVIKTDSSSKKSNALSTGNRERKKLDPSEWHSDPDQPAIQRVFDHWQKTFGYTTRTLNDERRQSLKRVIAKGADVDRMLKAIDNVKASPWHNGDNPWRRHNTEIRYIFKDLTQIDELADLVPRLTTANKSPFHASQKDMSLKATNLKGGYRF